MGDNGFDMCLSGHTSFIHTLVVPTPTSPLLMSADSKGVVIVWTRTRGVEATRWNLKADTHKVVVLSSEQPSHGRRLDQLGDARGGCSGGGEGRMGATGRVRIHALIAASGDRLHRRELRENVSSGTVEWVDGSITCSDVAVPREVRRLSA